MQTSPFDSTPTSPLGIDSFEDVNLPRVNGGALPKINFQRCNADDVEEEKRLLELRGFKVLSPIFRDDICSIPYLEEHAYQTLVLEILFQGEGSDE